MSTFKLSFDESIIEVIKKFSSLDLIKKYENLVISQKKDDLITHKIVAREEAKLALMLQLSDNLETDYHQPPRHLNKFRAKKQPTGWRKKIKESLFYPTLIANTLMAGVQGALSFYALGTMFALSNIWLLIGGGIFAFSNMILDFSFNGVYSKNTIFKINDNSPCGDKFKFMLQMKFNLSFQKEMKRYFEIQHKQFSIATQLKTMSEILPHTVAGGESNKEIISAYEKRAALIKTVIKGDLFNAIENQYEHPYYESWPKKIAKVSTLSIGMVLGVTGTLFTLKTLIFTILGITSLAALSTTGIGLLIGASLTIGVGLTYFTRKNALFGILNPFAESYTKAKKAAGEYRKLYEPENATPNDMNLSQPAPRRKSSFAFIRQYLCGSAVQPEPAPVRQQVPAPALPPNDRNFPGLRSNTRQPRAVGSTSTEALRR